MNLWVDNFLWWLLIMAIVGWIIPDLFWWKKFGVMIRVIICSVSSFAALSVIGALLAFTTHLSEYGMGKVISAAIADINAAVYYFTEVGWETGVVWLPLILVKMIIMGLRNSR